MSEVVKEASVATGTLYIYFENKEHLINRLYLELKRRNAVAYATRYDPKASFMIAFEQLWYSYFHIALKIPETIAFIEQYYRSPYTDPKVRQESDHLVRPIFDLLERGKEERLVKDMPAELLAIQLVGSINEFVRWHQNGFIKELHHRLLAKRLTSPGTASSANNHLRRFISPASLESSSGLPPPASGRFLSHPVVYPALSGTLRVSCIHIARV